MTQRFEGPLPAFHRALLKYGSAMTASPRGHPLDGTKPAKECYRNALETLEFESEPMGYGQGYFMAENLPVPIEHAWNVDEDLDVVDTTLSADLREGAVYFGIYLSRDDYEICVNRVLLSGHFASLTQGEILLRMAEYFPEELEGILARYQEFER